MSISIVRHGLACAFLAVFVVLIRIFLLRGEQPTYHLSYQGHSATVEYDENHVPFMRGSSDPAIFYALGYVEASDRLWQMDLLRHIASGTLSEVISCARKA